MKDLSPKTRRALKLFDCITKTSRLSFGITMADDDWYAGRKGTIGDALAKCQTESNSILYAHCPNLGFGAFVTFPADQGTATDSQIIQALRLECIRRTERMA